VVRSTGLEDEVGSVEGAATILLVDDEVDVRRLLRATLAQREYRLLEAATGDEAFDLVRRERPRVVLLDVAIPGADGYEVCRQIKGDPALAGTVVLLVTAQADDVARERGEQCGADAHVVKPFSPARLLELIDRYARSS
jgi:CheY-like chemotaxis protein